jgi:hypothetical protein
MVPIVACTCSCFGDGHILTTITMVHMVGHSILSASERRLGKELVLSFCSDQPDLLSVFLNREHSVRNSHSETKTLAKRNSC